MTKKRSNRISTFGSQLTSVISVSLVLLVLGVIAVAALVGRTGSQMLKSNIGFIVKVEREAPESDINRLKQLFNEAPYVASYIYSSSEEILSDESQYLGEDIISLIDVNPYGSEFDVKVRQDYAVIDSIEAISAALRRDAAVEDVLTESSAITAINDGLERITLILAAIALVLMAISVVLIFNTVHLAIYSRRFVMYTMRLVGATKNFIRLPYIKAGAINGLISAAIASALLIGAMAYASKFDPMLSDVFTAKMMAIVSAGLFIVGLTICTVASFFAATRYLRSDYDDMFMK